MRLVPNPAANRDAPNKPLHPRDTPLETFECRRAEPIYCKNYRLPKVCAWVRSDKMCLCPPVGWEKRFAVLKRKARRKTVQAQ
jgi:hypothetical protein